MKSVFVVGCKLLGLYLIWSSFTIVFQLFGYFAMSMSTSDSVRELAGSLFDLGGILLYFLLTLGFGLLLLWRTESVVNLVGIAGGEGIPSASSAKDFLPVGIVLIGVYMIGYGLPHLAKGLLSTFYQLRKGDMTLTWQMTELLSSALSVGIGVLFARYPSEVLSRIQRAPEDGSENL